MVEIFVPRLGNHPQLLRLGGRFEKSLRVLGPGALVLFAADDENGAAQLAGVIGGFDLVDGQAEPLLRKRDQQAAGEAAG